jgi:hypothetical protein
MAFAPEEDSISRKSPSGEANLPTIMRGEGVPSEDATSLARSPRLSANNFNEQKYCELTCHDSATGLVDVRNTWCQRAPGMPVLPVHPLLRIMRKSARQHSTQLLLDRRAVSMRFLTLRTPRKGSGE